MGHPVHLNALLFKNSLLLVLALAFFKLLMFLTFALVLTLLTFSCLEITYTVHFSYKDFYVLTSTCQGTYALVLHFTCNHTHCLALDNFCLLILLVLDVSLKWCWHSPKLVLALTCTCPGTRRQLALSCHLL